jgi:hypothetical protein
VTSSAHTLFVWFCCVVPPRLGYNSCKASYDALPNVTTLTSLTQVATKGKDLRARRE